MSDPVSSPQTPFSAEAPPPEGGVVSDPLAGDWSQGLPGPVRALGIPEPSPLAARAVAPIEPAAAPVEVPAPHGVTSEPPVAHAAEDSAPPPVVVHEVIAEGEVTFTEPPEAEPPAEAPQPPPNDAAVWASAMARAQAEDGATPWSDPLPVAAPAEEGWTAPAAPPAVPPAEDGWAAVAAPADAVPDLAAPMEDGWGAAAAPAPAAPAEDAWAATVAPAAAVPAEEAWEAAASPSAAPVEDAWAAAAPAPAPPEDEAWVAAASPAAAAVEDAWAPPAAAEPAEWSPPETSSDFEPVRAAAEAAPVEAAANWDALSPGPDWSAGSAAPAAEAPAQAWGAPPPAESANAWDASPAAAVSDAQPEAWEAPAPAPEPSKPSWNQQAVGASALEQLESLPPDPEPGAAVNLFAPLGAGESLAGDDDTFGAAAVDGAANEAPVVDDDPNLLVPLDEPPPPPMAKLAAIGREKGNPLLVEGEHRVAIHTRGGRTRRGSVTDVDLAKSSFLLAPQGGGEPETVYHAEVKAIFFMLAAGEKAENGDGGRIRVTFADGRSVEGVREGGEGKHGFFFVPADAQRTNTRRVYVAREAVTDVKNL